MRASEPQRAGKWRRWAVEVRPDGHLQTWARSSHCQFDGPLLTSFIDLAVQRPAVRVRELIGEKRDTSRRVCS